MADVTRGQNNQDQDWELQFLDGGSIDDDLAQFGEDELIVNALKVGGGDLLQYARKLEADLRRKETEAIEDYVKQTAGVADLRLHVEECDNYLKVFEETLVNFQNELGHVGGQIKDMNARAQALDTLASNRRQADTRLASFIHGGTLPKRLAKAVHEEEVGPAYVPLLHTLEAKRSFFESKQHAQTAMAGHVIPVLDRLQAQALERVQSTLLLRVKTLPHQLSSSFKTDTGGATAAQEKFCALGPCVAFLRRHSMQGYQEVLDKYVESMRAGLGAQLRHIEREVSRHQVEVLKHGDTLFTPGQRKGFRAVLSKAGTLGQGKKDGAGDREHEVRIEAFELSERINAVALVQDPTSILFDPTEEHAPEASFGAVVGALIAKIEAQQAILRAVFPAHPPDILLSLFQTALQGLGEWAAAAVGESVDPVSLLICIRILQAAHDKVEALGMRHMLPLEEADGESGEGGGERKRDKAAQAGEAHKEKEEGGAARGGEDGAAKRKGGGGNGDAAVVSEVEGVFSALIMAVWPRFKGAVEGQVQSLKTAGTSSASVPSGSDKAVHKITTRYAQLTAALLVTFARLHSQSALMASTSITYMCHAMEKFVQRGGEQLGGGLKACFFAINQYDHILSVYHLAGVQASQCARMRALLHANTDALLPLLLGSAYKEMVETVAAVEGGAALQEKQAGKLAEDFAKGHTTAFSTMHSTIAGSVCSAPLCSELHKKAACQLLMTYGSFRALVEQHLGGHAVCQKLVAEEHLVLEIKKYDVTANFLDA